jgi:broad specificity phosphatase PhoE
MLLVVRHADAGDKRSWRGPDRLRPLSPTGRRQAEGLVVCLEDYPVDRILSSPTLRSQQTVQPLAADRFLKVEPLAALGVDTGPTQLRAVFWDRGLGNVVLCTHGEVIGWLLTQLVAEGLVVEDRLDWPMGSTWLLQRTTQVRSMVASWLRWRSRASSSPGPENVPVNDHLPGVVTDCPPARNLVVTMDRKRAPRRPDARAGAARVRPPPATSSRWPAAPEGGEPGREG